MGSGRTGAAGTRSKAGRTLFILVILSVLTRVRFFPASVSRAGYPQRRGPEPQPETLEDSLCFPRLFKQGNLPEGLAMRRYG